MMAIRPVYERLGSTQNPAPEQVAKRHVVTAGEEIAMIAQREYRRGYYAEDWRQIAEANDINDLDVDLTAGRVLKIPSPQAPST